MQWADRDVPVDYMTREEELNEREDLLRAREEALEEYERSLRAKEDALDYQLRDAEARIDAEVAERQSYAQLWQSTESELAQIASSSSSESSPGLNLQWILAHLEDQYQCTLCCDTLASPYTLNNPLCGHTFCAMCLLKWAFADICPECHYWHEALKCPLCRAKLPYKREEPPRSVGTFPFVPNRLAAESLKTFVAVLQHAADSELDDEDAAVKRKGWHGEVDEKVLAWASDQIACVEWSERARRGESTMASLAELWEHLDTDDFAQFKQTVDDVDE